MAYTGIPLNQKGAANGVASLGATGKVPTAQLPTLSGDAVLLGAFGDYMYLELDAYDAQMMPISVSLPTLQAGSLIVMTMVSSVWSSQMHLEVFDPYGFPLHFNDDNEATSRALWTQMGSGEWMLHSEGPSLGVADQYIGNMTSVDMELWFISDVDIPAVWEGMFGINLYAVKG